MIVLVSMRSANSSSYFEPRDGISHDWLKLFIAYDIIPVLVPNVVGAIDRYFDLKPGGLLLTGGDDLGPEQDPTDRDRTEEGLLSEALARDIPVFGVCRGLQMINRHFGGQVERHLPEPHIGEHQVYLASGQTVCTNSFHNGGVLLGGVAPVLSVFASTQGGVVEGIRHPTLPVVAVQWHPERQNPARDLDKELLQEWRVRCA